MLKKHGGWMELGSADEQKPAKGRNAPHGAFCKTTLISTIGEEVAMR